MSENRLPSEMKIASGKVFPVSVSKKNCHFKRRWREIELFKQVGFPELFILTPLCVHSARALSDSFCFRFRTYKEEMNFCFVGIFTEGACIISF